MSSVYDIALIRRAPTDDPSRFLHWLSIANGTDRTALPSMASRGGAAHEHYSTDSAGRTGAGEHAVHRFGSAIYSATSTVASLAASGCGRPGLPGGVDASATQTRSRPSCFAR